jgi:hypothetical protein
VLRLSESLGVVWEVGRGDGDIWNGPWHCGVLVVLVAAGKLLLLLGPNSEFGMGFFGS